MATVQSETPGRTLYATYPNPYCAATTWVVWTNNGSTDLHKIMTHIEILSPIGRYNFEFLDPRWRTAAILKTAKSLLLSSGLNDLEKNFTCCKAFYFMTFEHNNVNRCHRVNCQNRILKIFTIRGRFKKRKNCPQNFQIL